MYETCQELIRRQPNKPERNYIELTPGMAVWSSTGKIHLGNQPQL